MDILAELQSIKADYASNKEVLAKALEQTAEFKASLEAKELAFSEVSTSLETVKSELAKATEDLTAKTGELEAIKNALAELKLKESTAEAKAIDIAASVGIAPLKVDASESQTDLLTKEEATAHYSELIKLNTREASKQAAEYFAKHQALITKR